MVVVEIVGGAVLCIIFAIGAIKFFDWLFTPASQEKFQSHEEDEKHEL